MLTGNMSGAGFSAIGLSSINNKKVFVNIGCFDKQRYMVILQKALEL
jgi:hypothetical protein